MKLASNPDSIGMHNDGKEYLPVGGKNAMLGVEKQWGSVSLILTSGVVDPIELLAAIKDSNNTVIFSLFCDTVNYECHVSLFYFCGV